MSVRDIRAWLTALLFPPICRACGERQTIFAAKLPGVLCPSCMQRWEQEKAASCQKKHADCLCVPSALQHSGVDAFVHLAQYHPHTKGVAATMILRGKDNNDREMFRFLAKELAVRVRSVLGDAADAVVTYVPRRRAAVQATGHDHAKQIAHALSGELRLPLAVALRRRPLTRQQKQLDAAEREKNAARSFELPGDVNLTGKTVVLVDDVCTTGTSLSACTMLLREAGAARIVCAVIARTGKSD